MKTQPPMSDEAKKTREDIEKKLLENASRLLENAETMAVQNTQDTQFTVTTPIEINIQNADGSEKIQRIETELNLIKQNQSASTAGAPVIV
jgi:ribosomal protein L1